MNKKTIPFIISLSWIFFRLGFGKFITQSLLIIVEDINDNIPVFEPHTPSILVREHSSTPLELISLTAHDKDSGIYGQVIYSLESDQPEDLDLFSVSTVNNQAELKLIGKSTKLGIYLHGKKYSRNLVNIWKIFQMQLIFLFSLIHKTLSRNYWKQKCPVSVSQFPSFFCQK